MADYIKRSDAMTICERYSEHCFETSDSRGQDIADRILDDIAEMRTADVVEVKHGHWISIPYNPKKPYPYECSRCGLVADKAYDYCHCGAKMDVSKMEITTERKDT
jgi:hypothetical protein